MNEEVEFLEYIYQNAITSENNIRIIRKERKVKDEFDDILKNIIVQYKKFCSSLKAMIERRKKKIDDISVLTQFVTYMNVKINIAADGKISTIAQMIIQGTNMEKDEIYKKINEYNFKNRNIQNIANKMLKFEEEIIEKLEKYC